MMVGSVNVTVPFLFYFALEPTFEHEYGKDYQFSIYLQLCGFVFSIIGIVMVFPIHNLESRIILGLFVHILVCTFCMFLEDFPVGSFIGIFCIMCINSGQAEAAASARYIECVSELSNPSQYISYGSFIIIQSKFISTFLLGLLYNGDDGHDMWMYATFALVVPVTFIYLIFLLIRGGSKGVFTFDDGVDNYGTQSP